MNTYQKAVHGEWQAGSEPLKEKVGEREERAREHESTLELTRTNLGVSAFENSMLFILHIILGITEITGRRNSAMPCGLLNLKHRDTKLK
eukprot:847493-Pelagomonas_calceolata.AAC.2